MAFRRLARREAEKLLRQSNRGPRAWRKIRGDRLQLQVGVESLSDYDFLYRVTENAMKAMECTNCGARAPIVRGDYQFREVGLKNVVLQGIRMGRCPKCGNEDAILPGVNRIMRVVALALIGKPHRLRGEEVRFLRSFLGMTADKFSRFVHVDRTTLSKWENGEDPVGAQSDLLIRMLALALGDGLQEKTSAAIEGFPKIGNRPRAVQIQVQSSSLDYHYA
jgi:DNA-binding transcriptional regulator YiaG